MEAALDVPIRHPRVRIRAVGAEGHRRRLRPGRYQHHPSILAQPKAAALPDVPDAAPKHADRDVDGAVALSARFELEMDEVGVGGVGGVSAGDDGVPSGPADASRDNVGRRGGEQIAMRIDRAADGCEVVLDDGLCGGVEHTVFPSCYFLCADALFPSELRVNHAPLRTP